MTTALEGGGRVSVTTRPLFTPRKDPVPIVQKAGWAPRLVWTDAENLAPPGCNPWTVQLIASRYTELPGPYRLHNEWKFKSSYCISSKSKGFQKIKMWPEEHACSNYTLKYCTRSVQKKA